jgi:hypothetical protein
MLGNVLPITARKRQIRDGFPAGIRDAQMLRWTKSVLVLHVPDAMWPNIAVHIARKRA